MGEKVYTYHMKGTYLLRIAYAPHPERDLSPQNRETKRTERAFRSSLRYHIAVTGNAALFAA